MIKRLSWAGANIGSYQTAADAMRRLADVTATAKQVRRVTTDVGRAAVDEREQPVREHAAKPLVRRLTPRPDIAAPELGVVMMDDGRLQRRDHFGDHSSDTQRTTHWKEDKVGLCLSMRSREHDEDPSPAFPRGLAGGEVVAEIARLGCPQTQENTTETAPGDDSAGGPQTPWTGSPE